MPAFCSICTARISPPGHKDQEGKLYCDTCWNRLSPQDPLDDTDFYDDIPEYNDKEL